MTTATTATKSAHTPGPWRYQEESDAYTHIVRGPKGEFVVSAAQDTSGTAEADTRLIAAAPEMLEALKAIRNEVIGLAAYLLSCDTEVIIKNLETTVASLERNNALVDAAIQKALGQDAALPVSSGHEGAVE